MTATSDYNITVQHIAKIANAYGSLNKPMTYIQALNFLYDQIAPEEAIKISHAALKEEYGAYPERPSLALNLARKIGIAQQQIRETQRRTRNATI